MLWISSGFTENKNRGHNKYHKRNTYRLLNISTSRQLDISASQQVACPLQGAVISVKILACVAGGFVGVWWTAAGPREGRLGGKNSRCSRPISPGPLGPAFSRAHQQKLPAAQAIKKHRASDGILEFLDWTVFVSKT